MESLNGTKLREILEECRFSFSKSLGQNFLSDERILTRIADDASLKNDDTVLEIGPGAGTLTRVMARRTKKVISVEIDRSLRPVLERTLSGFTNTEIIFGDFLRMDLAQLFSEHLESGFKVVANLPYYITTPIIMRLLESHLPCRSLTILVQREVAQRMAAKPGTPEYGSLSCAVQYYADCRLQTRLSPACFTPRPKVESQVITLNIRSVPSVAVKDEKMFFRVIHSAFAMRRKTFANNLIREFSLSREEAEALLAHCTLPAQIRGECLSLPQLALVSDALSERTL